MKNRAVIFSEEVSAERWTGYKMVELRFKSGEEIINLLIPEEVANKLSERLDYLLDETSER